MNARTTTRPAWRIVDIHALLPEHLPRCLAGMGFDLPVTTLPRGDIRWWPPEYQRVAPWQRRYEFSDSEAGRGWRAGAWTQDAIDQREAWQAADRDRAGTINRALRDAEVLVMAKRRDQPRFEAGVLVTHDLTLIDTGSGEWRSPNGAQRGDGMIELGMLMWACRYGQAGYRLARLCGLDGVPEVAHAA